MEETRIGNITFEHDEDHDPALDVLKSKRGGSDWDDILEGRETFKATVGGYGTTFSVEKINKQRYRIRKTF